MRWRQTKRSTRRRAATVCPLSLSLSLALLAPGIARVHADEVHLKSGGVVRGEVTREPGGVRVRLATGIETFVATADIARVVEQETPQEVYRARLEALDRTDADGHYRLGLFCREHRLRKEATERFRHAVAVRPDHAGAHTALGEVLLSGRWVPLEVANRARGLVRYKKRWVTPPEKAKLERRERLQAAWVRLRRAERTLRLAGASASSREAAFRAIAGERTPIALTPLLELSRSPYALARRAAVRALGWFPKGDGVARALARAADRDDHLGVQDAAADAIRQARLAEACEHLLRDYAQSPLAGVRSAAAHALGRARYKRAIPVLLATLRYRVRRRELVPVVLGPGVEAIPGGILVRGVGRLRVRSFGLEGSQLRIVDDFAFNDAARTALRAITEVDHDYDTYAWAAWWNQNQHRFGAFMGAAR